MYIEDYFSKQNLVVNSVKSDRWKLSEKWRSFEPFELAACTKSKKRTLFSQLSHFKKDKLFSDHFRLTYREGLGTSSLTRPHRVQDHIVNTKIQKFGVN